MRSHGFGHIPMDLPRGTLSTSSHLPFSRPSLLVLLHLFALQNVSICYLKNCMAANGAKPLSVDRSLLLAEDFCDIFMKIGCGEGICDDLGVRL